MEKLKNKFKKSFFVINKIYLFIIFLGLLISDFALGLFYFLATVLIFARKTLKAKIPINIHKDFDMITRVYKQTDKSDLKLDIWFPDSDRELYPMVFFCHGGGWISGFRNQPNNISWCKFLANKGFVVVSIDYRYGYKYNMMDILSDYNDALIYVRNHHKEFKIDIEDITLMGLSAGGHLALLYATYFTSIKDEEFMKDIRSVVAYYPPTNLNDMLIDENKSLFTRLATRQTIKGSPTEIEDVYAYYSPITYLTENMIPVLLVHGEKDDVVPFASSIRFATKLLELNVPFEFLTHKEGKHTFDTSLKDYRTIDILEKTARFIKKH